VACSRGRRSCWPSGAALPGQDASLFPSPPPFLFPLFFFFPLPFSLSLFSLSSAGWDPGKEVRLEGGRDSSELAKARKRRSQVEFLAVTDLSSFLPPSFFFFFSLFFFLSLEEARSRSRFEDPDVGIANYANCSSPSPSLSPLPSLSPPSPLSFLSPFSPLLFFYSTRREGGRGRRNQQGAVHHRAAGRHVCFPSPPSLSPPSSSLFGLFIER